MYEIAHYLTDEGGDRFQEWLESLRDRRAQARILVRIERLRCAAFGDGKPLCDGVWELRIDHGPGREPVRVICA
jgi:putative addiction module killer protein